MPDKDIETRYYNSITLVEEWRCYYYTTGVFKLTSRTKGPNDHLLEYGLKKGDP